MITSEFAVLALIVFLVSWFCTGCARWYAVRKNVIDLPNSRSSHSLPTPRGGGIGFVVALLAALLYLGLRFNELHRALFVLWPATILIALVGFVDDHRHIPARWRLIAHFMAAGWVMYGLGGLPSLGVDFELVRDSTVRVLLGCLLLVWLLNLFNFMDGIDGIAAVQAITSCLGMLLVVLVAQFPNSLDLELLVLPAIFAAAVAGFLVWNFPTARIFMGDVGSGFLGMALGAMALLAASAAPKLFWSWMIMLGVFIVDATITLTRRFIRGMKLHEAHRSHAYQHAARRFGSHGKVTFAVASINVFWLFPIAIFVGSGALAGPIGLVLAYIPLTVLAFVFCAGMSDAVHGSNQS